MEIIYALIASIIIMFASLSGVLFLGPRAQKFIEKYHHHVLAFSVGVLCVVLYSLSIEGIEHMENGFLFTLGAIIGVIILVGVSYFLKHPEHHHETNHGHEHSTIDGNHVIISDSVHNISDGLILIPAFAAGTIIGIGTTIAILVHEAISEIAEFFVLKESGFTNKEALARNFISSSSIVLGVIISFFAIQSELLEPWIFSVSAGAFAYLIFVDLIPCLFTHKKTNSVLSQYIISALIGALLMFSIQSLMPHEHEDEGHETTAAVLQLS